jgi:hypothetical protein
MSKFLLNLLVQISIALVNSEIQFFRNSFSLLSARPTLRPTRSLAQPAPLASLLSRAKFNLAGLASPRVDGVFAEVRFPFWFTLSSWPPPSRLSVKSARAVRFVFLPHRPTVTTSSRRLWPPHATRPPTSRCQARSSFHALIPPLISLLNPSSSRPAINGIKAITVGRFPLPHPCVPLPGHYKRTRSTPRPSPHSPRPQSLASESAAPTPPSASSADCSPPAPNCVRPSAAPSCNR